MHFSGVVPIMSIMSVLLNIMFASKIVFSSKKVFEYFAQFANHHGSDEKSACNQSDSQKCPKGQNLVYPIENALQKTNVIDQKIAQYIQHYQLLFFDNLSIPPIFIPYPHGMNIGGIDKLSKKRS